MFFAANLPVGCSTPACRVGDVLADAKVNIAALENMQPEISIVAKRGYRLEYEYQFITYVGTYQPALDDMRDIREIIDTPAKLLSHFLSIGAKVFPDKRIMHIPKGFLPAADIVFEPREQTEMQKHRAATDEVLRAQSAAISRQNTAIAALRNEAKLYGLRCVNQVFSCSYPDEDGRLLRIFRERIMECPYFINGRSFGIRTAVANAATLADAMNLAQLFDLWPGRVYSDDSMLGFILDWMAASGLMHKGRSHFSYTKHGIGQIATEGDFWLTFVVTDKVGVCRRIPTLEELCDDDLVEFKGLLPWSDSTIYYSFK